MSSILKVSEIQDPTNGNTALAIDSSGNVKTKNIYVAAALSSLQNLTDDTFTVVQFNTEVASNGLSWDTSNYKCTFSAANAGTYAITVGIAFFSSTNTFQEAQIKPMKNSSQICNTICLANGSGGGTTLGAVRHFCGYSNSVATFVSGDEFSVQALFEVGSGNADIHERQYGTELRLMRLGD